MYCTPAHMFVRETERWYADTNKTGEVCDSCE